MFQAIHGWGDNWANGHVLPNCKQTVWGKRPKMILCPMLKITNQGFTFSWWQKLCDERDSLQKTFGEAKRRRKPKRETNHTKPHRWWMMLYTLHTCCLHAKEHTNKHTFTAVICWHANKPQMFYTSFPQTKNMCTLGNLRRTSCKSIRESLHFLEKWDLNNVSFLFLFCFCFVVSNMFKQFKQMGMAPKPSRASRGDPDIWNQMVT